MGRKSSTFVKRNRFSLARECYKLEQQKFTLIWIYAVLIRVKALRLASSFDDNVLYYA